MRDEVKASFDLPPDKVDVVPNGVDPSAWRPAPVDAGSPDGALLVSWGRLQYEKGFQTLLGAIARLRGDHPDLRAVIVGRGSYADELHRLRTLAGKGMALKAIAKALIRSEESVKQRAKEDGLKIARLR